LKIDNQGLSVRFQTPALLVQGRLVFILHFLLSSETFGRQFTLNSRDTI
jgi:hypothetical protein